MEWWQWVLIGTATLAVLVFLLRLGLDMLCEAIAGVIVDAISEAFD